MPRHGQLRSVPKLKRSYKEMVDEAEKIIEIGSQHLADNESIHSSLRHSFDNQGEIGVSMVIEHKPEDI